MKMDPRAPGTLLVSCCFVSSYAAAVLQDSCCSVAGLFYVILLAGVFVLYSEHVAGRCQKPADLGPGAPCTFLAVPFLWYFIFNA